MDLIRFASEKKAHIILTTDHGSIKILNPTKVVGDKEYKCQPAL